MENNKPKRRSRIGVYAIGTALGVIAAGGAGFGIAAGVYHDPELEKEHDITITKETSIITNFDITADKEKAKMGDHVIFTVVSKRNDTLVPRAIKITTVPKEGSSEEATTSLYALTATSTEGEYQADVIIQSKADMVVSVEYDTLADWIVKFDTGCDTTIDDQPVARGHLVNDPQKTLTKTGYTFTNKWYIDGETEPFDFESRIIEGNITLKAGWAINKHTVTWTNWDDKVLGTTTDVEYGTVPVYSGATPTRASTDQYVYTFIGWEGGIKAMPDSDVTYKAEYASVLNKHTATFTTDGTYVAPQTVEWGNLLKEPKSTKDGYTLEGWYNGDTKWNFTSDKLTTDITLTAKWTKNKYTIKFDTAGGKETISSIEKEYESTITEDEVTTPTRDGFVFDAWYCDGVKVTFPYTIKKDATFTAKWNEKWVTVTFKDGSSTLSTQKVQKDIGYATKPTNPTKTGYTFKYWYTTDSSTEFNFSTTTFTADTTLNALWEQNKYTVKFNLAGGDTGTGPSDIENVVHGSTLTKPSKTPTKTGCTFAGWYLNDTKFIFSDETGTATTVTDNITLVARWTTDTYYTVNFYLNDSSSSTTVYATEAIKKNDVAVQPTDPTLTDKVFYGWYTDKTCAAGTEFDFSTKITANTSVYAKWASADNFNGTEWDTAMTAINTFETYASPTVAQAQTLCAALGVDASETTKTTAKEVLEENLVGITGTIEIYGTLHTIRCIGAMHDTMTDGTTTVKSGKAALTFELSTLLSDENGDVIEAPFDYDMSEKSGVDYTNSTLRRILTNEGSGAFPGKETDPIHDSLPDYIQNNLKTVKKEVYIRDGSETLTAYNDTLFPLTCTEINTRGEYPYTEGTAYKYYSDHSEDEDKVKREAAGGKCIYWLCSPTSLYPYGTHYIGTDGGPGTIRPDDDDYAISFAFCL